MTGQMMEFPKTFDEFVDSYGLVDTEEVYTNGSQLIPVFRVKQWLEHIKALSENKGDLISRQAVLELVANYDLSMGQVVKGIHALPSVENKGEWILVSERLPDEEHEVYCQLSDGSNAVLYVQDNWGQMDWVDGMMGTGTYDVVAWREKPEPYKEGGE